MPVLAAPPGPLVLNNEHPLTYLLTDCRVFGVGTDVTIAPNLVTRYPVDRKYRRFDTANPNNPTRTTIDGIPALNFAAASSQAMTNFASNTKYSYQSRASVGISSFGLSIGVIASLGSSTATLRNVYGNCSGYARYSGISGAASADKWVAQFAGGGAYEQNVTSTNSFSTGVNYAVLGTMSGRALVDYARARVWVDGSLEATSTSAYTGSETTDYILVGSTNSATNYHNGTLSLGCIWARELHGHEAALWGRDPWGMFRPRRPWNIMAPAGGGSYTDTITDSLTLADTPLAVMTAQGTMSEAVTLADTPSAVLSAQAALTDAVTLADTAAAAATLQATTTDGITLGDTIVSGAAYAVTITDGLTLTDAILGGAAFVSTITDGITLGEAVASASAFLGTIAETLTVGDAAAAQATLNATLADAITLADLPVSVLSGIGTITEPVTLGDGTTAIATMRVTLTDGVTLADTITAPGASVFVVGVEFKWTTSDQPRVWSAPTRPRVRH